MGRHRSALSDWREGAHRRAQGRGQGSGTDAVTQPQTRTCRRDVWATATPHPGVPSGPDWHLGRGTSSTLSPICSMPTAPWAPGTTQRSTEQPPAASLAHGPCPRPSRAVCGAASRLLGRAGIDRRPGKSRFGRSEQGRAGEERRAARSLAGASGMRGYRASGACCLWKAAPCRQCLPAESPQGLPTPTR